MKQEERETPVHDASPWTAGVFCLHSVERQGGYLRRLPHSLFQQLGDDLVNHLIGQRPHFVLRLGLDRVLYQDRLILRHAQG